MNENLYCPRDSKAKVLNDNHRASSYILVIIIVLFALFCLWASICELDELARTDKARVSPTIKTQYIQSLDGGILKKISITLIV